ncbi:hypothetical protein [Streptomyces sp. WAC05950]|uniref:hypothetical protein n=1 Tax=Streptomyces sp. WAC05950 TaxID=2487419 RepID=UPI000F73C792|nr:hypothetical protein [Streptomyces sp. WAC05950]RST03700.1 hypothetical protein EF904_20435 [Streptomyces sp. WAC05950]
MTKARKNDSAPTSPSQAPGESGDPEAREEAEEAVLPDTHEGEAGDALTPSSDAQRRAAKKANTGGRSS